MNKNKLIKENLEYHLKKSVELLRGDFSYPKLLEKELINVDKIKWFANPEADIESYKREWKNNIKELLNDTHLHKQIDDVICELIDIRHSLYQQQIENQLIENFTNISSSISNDNSFQLNILFMEHNYDPEAYFCGYDDPDYQFELLSGQEYLKYNHDKDLFNGVGRFDYTSFLSPILNFEKELGEDKVDMINEALTEGYYLEEIKKLFLLNTFYGIHLSMDRLTDTIRKMDIPLHDEVFIFANEHDCEQLNVFVL